MGKAYKIGLLVAGILGMVSCVKPPNYPMTPVITYQSLQVNSDGSAVLKVNFTDGLGDIGYPSDQTGSPPDFFIEIQYQNASGGYTTYTQPGTVYNPGTTDTTISQYHIPDITPAGKYKELSGQISIALGSEWYLQNNINERLVVWLTDRAGNSSNRIITPAVATP